jgi:hypothetical protein
VDDIADKYTHAQPDFRLFGPKREQWPYHDGGDGLLGFVNRRHNDNRGDDMDDDLERARARAQYRADERKRRAEQHPVPDYAQRFDDDLKLHVALDIAADIGPDCG